MPGDCAVAKLQVLALAAGGAVLGHPLRPHGAAVGTASRRKLREPAVPAPQALQSRCDRIGSSKKRALTLHAQIEQRVLGVGGRQRTRVAALERVAQQLGDGLACVRSAHGRRPLASFADTGSAIPVSLR